MRHMDRAAVRSRRISGFLTETLLSLSCTQPRARLKYDGELVILLHLMCFSLALSRARG